MKYSFLQCGDGAVTVCFSNEISETANSYVTEFVRIAKQKKSKASSNLYPLFHLPPLFMILA